MEIPPKQPLIDYITVPAGAYRVRIAEVRERQTRAGHTMWALHLVGREALVTVRPVEYLGAEGRARGREDPRARAETLARGSDAREVAGGGGAGTVGTREPGDDIALPRASERTGLGGGVGGDLRVDKAAARHAKKSTVRAGRYEE